MQTVSKFEADLLRLLYFILKREPVERARQVLELRVENPPRYLSDGAVRLIQSSLAKGCALILAHRGGWRDEIHLRSGKPAGGRLW
ncbi:MAG: hypothetical protein ACKO23_05640, partial [Gemmataceae bacterium]